jgi:hypothetical protein
MSADNSGTSYVRDGNGQALAGSLCKLAQNHC